MIHSIASIANQGFSFWYSLCCELQVSSVYDYTSNLNMDFDALMSKKLGGKYLKPSQVEKKVQEHVGSAKDGQDEIILTPPPKEINKNSKPGAKKSYLEAEGHVQPV